MAQLVEQLIRNEQVASSSLAIGFFILSKLPSADSHYNFCRLTKIVSSANKFAYGYVTFGLPALTNISCRVFAIGFFIICHCERSALPRKTIKYCFSRGQSSRLNYVQHRLLRHFVPRNDMLYLPPTLTTIAT